MLRRIIRKVRNKLGFTTLYPSETSKVRHLVQPYCVGYGCDIGFGGDKLKPDSVGIDLPTPYAHTGNDTVEIACDVIKDEIPVPDNTFDYAYTSHLIEDFEETKSGLTKFIRIVKDGGNLILVFPDQKAYEAHCKRTGQPLNLYHKHADMGLSYMIDELKKIKNISFDILFVSDREIDYNVVLVLKIRKNG